ncbi:EamA family transporter [Desulfovibrio sp.]|uniref:EamA family transporter n=1 Tax=Desulfovibrio sp. TaxID=885 RepID=UPI0023CC880C|nr:EamA family transporter [Desulfovibrio sp.]MDE7241144.1 DMT family transporter [Desulfovibrio sp.]
MTIPHWLYLMPLVLTNVCGSLLLKLGSGDKPVPLLLNFLSWRSFFGLACFGIGGLAYSWLLRYVPLTVAQTVLASQYIFTVTGAWLILHEPVDGVQLLGFLFVGVGIALVVSR